MTEIELNTIFNIVCDPEKNVYMLDSAKKIQEVQRIARIFNIAKETIKKMMIKEFI